ncbi:pilus assembly FimT family protein [Neomoorella thermoacetica]|uniref:pilus assembly FimT family protein n=1 Tax=Neomoorella thermoacetica TaxID=1525 RepID=UPI0030D35E11
MVYFNFYNVKKGHPAGGFTIVELVIVMAIMFVATAIAIPNMRSVYSRYVLYTVAREMAENIRFCQQKAVSVGEEGTTPYDVYFNIIYDKYEIRYNKKTLKTVELPRWVDLVGTNFPQNGGYFERNVVVPFNQTGKPVGGGGTIFLKDRVSQKYFYVIVNPITGLVRVSSTIS